MARDCSGKDCIMKTSKRTILQLMMIVIFLAFITVPFLFADFRGGEVAVMENRYLAKFPELFRNNTFNWQGGKLISQFESWINDNLAFRKEAKAAESYVQLQLLKTPVYDGTLYNRDSVLLWRFNDPDWMLSITEMDEKVLAEETEILRQVNEEMKTRGIAFSMTHLMPKYMAGDMYFPDALHRSAQSTYNPYSRKLSDYYRDNIPGLLINSSFDMMDALYANEGRPTYHPGFFTAFDASHWNELGAFLGYQVHMGIMAQSDPRIQFFSQDDYIITNQDYTKNRYGRDYHEQALSFYLKQERHAVKDNTMLETLGLGDLFNDWGSNAYYHVPGSTAPKALIIGDSYLWMFMLNDVAESFSETVFVNLENAGELWRMVDAFKPDVVSFCSIRINEIPRLMRQNQAQ